MVPTKRALWLGTFDREPFIAAILRAGTILSLLFIVAGAAWEWNMMGRLAFEMPLHGTNVLNLLMTTLSPACPLRWPQRLVHVGIGVLLLIPYARAVGSAWYFACVDRNSRYAALAGCVCLALTYVLLLG